MTVSTNIGVGGAWKVVKNISVGVGGAWKPVVAAWIGVGGVWKKIYDAFSITAGTNGSATGFADASAFAPFGSITPTSAQINGVDLLLLVDSSNSTTVYLRGNRATGFFNSITVNGHTYSTSNSTAVYDGQYTYWTWTVSVSPFSMAQLAVGNTYGITYT
jgi:hypothetical protein